jgi:mitogen-activated protein kinase 1/3
LDQIRRIIGVVGSPSAEDMSFIGNDQAKKYIKSLPRRNKQLWQTLYPKANPLALDLLSKMLVFNPIKRFTVEQCLSHPYFEGLHNEKSEPTCDSAFDWSFDNFKPTKDKLQEMIYELSLHFHPS